MDVGSLLLNRGLANEAQVDEARTQSQGRRVDRVLVELGVVTEEQVLRTIADALGLRFVSLAQTPIDRELLRDFPTSAIFRHRMLPLGVDDGRLIVATPDPFDLEALDEFSALSPRPIETVVATEEDVVSHIKLQLGVGGDTINQLVAQSADDELEVTGELTGELGELASSAQAPSVIRLVNELLMEALEQRASDVHIEPMERGLTIRFRVDGILRVQPVPPEIGQFSSAIITRLKIMSRLNIAEKRLPQDGRINVRVQGREIDVRVSIIPMLHGEGVVMRLLDKGRMAFDLNAAGMPSDVAAGFHRLIALPHGIVLVTGPTGSGKTTTLYSALNEIKSPEIKIITVEDPVEYQLPGISQIQVHAKIGLTFAAGLRSILRHDPDVVLIGEIRDGETASSAIQASLTGHLVFSTLHTNDAPGAFTRLVDMGVEPYLVASTLEGVLAQRLVRRLCAQCREAYRPDAEDLPSDFDRTTPTLWRPKGCRTCRDAGYTGRTGIFELLTNDAQIRHLCMEGASTGRLREHALSIGMETLRQSGYRKAIAGDTTLEEVLRITRGDAS